MLKDVFTVINQMQADGIIEHYALGGAVAATFYLEPISTIDVDFFISFPAVPGSLLFSTKPIFDYLTERGSTIEGEYLVVAGWPVQFLPPTSPLVEEGLNTAREFDLAGETVRVLSAEHLAAIALATGRAKDRARLVQFLDSGILDSERLHEIMQRHGLLPKWAQFRERFLRGAP
jgi:hypothetical protein